MYCTGIDSLRRMALLPVRVRTQTGMMMPLLFAVLVLAGCGQRGREEARAVQSVAFVTARQATVTRTVTLIGTVHGDRQATVMPNNAGRVTGIVKPEGSQVNQGDPILYVTTDIPGMEYRPAPVRAPFAGVVGRVYAEIGQTVAPAMPVAMVASYATRVRVRAGISDQDHRFVRTGALGTVTVPAWPDTAFTGRVDRLTPVLDPLSRTATVELVLDNPGRKLVPGMAASVRLVLEERENAVSVPLSALFTNDRAMLAVLDGRTARMREVEIGLLGDRLVEISSGLSVGEQVVTTGKERIEDGDEVNPVEDQR